MYQPRVKGRSASRCGAILIVVLALLALFAVIGLGFIFYANSEADVARAYRQAQSQDGAGGTAEIQGQAQEALNQFLRTLIYPEGDTATGTSLLNSLRGHDLASTIYGWCGSPGANTIAFNGVGAFDDATSLTAGLTSRRQIQNYSLINGTVYDAQWTGPPRAPGTPPTIGSRTYVGKNAGYTYADGNNFFLASIDPRTGEVLVPSFHRTGTLGFGDLGPTNPNWTSTQGRYLTLRPRPQENTGFPYVPQNADGTYTGDVQNLLGGYLSQMGSSTTPGTQRNDSLWMDVGLKPFQWNGKWIKPLVAPLIVDLDGRINLSAAGSLAAGKSFSGFGPWEINLASLLPDANAVVQSRYGGGTSPTPRNTVATSRAFNANVGTLPQYAPMNWTPQAGTTFMLPVTPSLMGVPTYTNYENNSTPAFGHPSLFSPAEWPAATAGSPRTFFHSDTRRLSLRYADRTESYALMDLAQPTATPVSAALRGNDTTTGFSRTDASHPLRMLFTTLSTGLDGPLLPPATLDYASSTYQLASDGHPYPNGATTPSVTATVPQPGVSVTGTQSDFDTANKVWANPLAALGGVDLNRKLTDYGTAGQALTPGNTLGNHVQAWADRHNLARDIFARLVIATGAKATVNPVNGNVTVPATVTTGMPEFEALRYLAQLAVNAVDFIDNDDIATVFVWNPQGGGGLVAVTSPGDIPQANYQAANVRSTLVVGVEKPRLLINEAYSEFVTDPNEMMLDPMAVPPKLPKNPVHVRTAIELVNPSTPPYSAGTGPLGTGAARLFYANGEDGATQPINSYQVLVLRDDTGTLLTELRKSDNARGDLPTGVQPKIQLDLATLNPTVKQVDPNNGQYASGSPGFVVLAPKVVASTNTPALDALNADIATGIAPAQLIQTNQPTGTVGTAETGSLTYVDDGAVPTDNDLKANSAFHQKMQKHVIVLRRLANPYQPVNDPDVGTFDNTKPANPYVTVDFLNYLPSMDAVYVSSDTTMAMPRPVKDGTNPDGYDPKTPTDTMYQRFAVGRVQPLAGYYSSTNPNGAPVVSDANTANHLLPQKPTTPPADGVNHTLGHHNGVDPANPTPVTLALPFDWLPHFDRPLTSPLELMMVGRVKPHELTQTFLPQTGANLVTGNAGGHLAKWIEPFTVGTAVGPTNPTTGLYRAFELLRVKPWDYNTPMGGKVHGRININAVQDQRILSAVLDPQSGNAFTTGEVTTITSTLLQSRTPTTRTATLPGGTPAQPGYVPSTTLVEMPTGTGTDRPFQSFGTAQQLLTGGTVLTGLADTMLRPNTTAGAIQPISWVAGTATGSTAHPYFQSDAARKMWHNITPVSNAFAVWMTIGFFEVQTDASGSIQYEAGSAAAVPPGRPLLGKEAYREVPGDLRQQYFSIIDRTNLTLDPTQVAIPDPANATNTTGISALTQGPRPFFTSLETAAGPSTGSMVTIQASNVSGSGNPVIYSDGQAIEIVPNDPVKGILYIGSGALPSNPLAATNPQAWATTRERVVVTAIATPFNSANGQVTLSIAPSLNYNHPAGSLVTNTVPGNPGPQPNFNYNSPTYQPVVPYTVRIK